MELIKKIKKEYKGKELESAMAAYAFLQTLKPKRKKKKT